jgi:hypothetical protein
MRQTWITRFVFAMSALLLAVSAIAGVAKSSTTGTATVTRISAGAPAAPSLNVIPRQSAQQPTPMPAPSSGTGTRTSTPADDSGALIALADGSDAGHDQGG